MADVRAAPVGRQVFSQGGPWILRVCETARLGAVGLGSWLGGALVERALEWVLG